MFSTYVTRKNNKFIPKKYHNKYVTRKDYILIILLPQKLPSLDHGHLDTNPQHYHFLLGQTYTKF